MGSRLLFCCILIFPYYATKAQDAPAPCLEVKQIDQKIALDGDISDPVWQVMDSTTGFWQYFPFDTARAEAQTQIKMAFDEQFLYVAFKCLDPVPGGYISSSLRRDFRGRHNDVITVAFDAFGDKTNGIQFGINPFGVKREALLSGLSGSGSSNGFDLSWDNKWYGEAKIHDGYWTAEMAIPFKTLRYKSGSQTWLANSYRLDSKTAEMSSWGNIPRNQSILSLAFSGELKFDEPLPEPGTNIALIPYVTGSYSRDYITGNGGLFNSGIGGDAKIAVTPSLNLDLTVNPDFSQVEVDVQQTNITRFELFFPERRQFFLENADIFASFGSSRLRPFFSRRIGLAVDESTGLTVPNPINFGARLSGRIDENWRIGAMNMQTAKNADINLPGYNYGVFALQRQMFSRSNLSAIFINRQATNRLLTEGDTTLAAGIDAQNYNRVVGLDYNLASADNTWSGKIFYHQGFAPNRERNRNFAHGANLTFNVPAVRVQWQHEWVGDQYDPAVGFVPRNDYFRINPEVQFTRYPNKKVTNYGPGVTSSITWNRADGKTDHLFGAFFEMNFSNSSEFRALVAQEYTYLFSAFDPTRTGGGEALPMGTSYRYGNFSAEYLSDQRKDVFFNVESQVGGFYNGNLWRVAGDLNYRYSRFAVLTLNFAYNNIRLPAPYASGEIFLLGPRFDITFTRKIFLTTFLQYNNQLDNLNINARLQYRFKPVSDFFLVYTDNYFPDNLKVKNRAIVAKLTYWLNL